MRTITFLVDSNILFKFVLIKIDKTIKRENEKKKKLCKLFHEHTKIRNTRNAVTSRQRISEINHKSNNYEKRLVITLLKKKKNY